MAGQHAAGAGGKGRVIKLAPGIHLVELGVTGDEACEGKHYGEHRNIVDARLGGKLVYGFGESPSQSVHQRQAAAEAENYRAYGLPALSDGGHTLYHNKARHCLHSRGTQTHGYNRQKQLCKPLENLHGKLGGEKQTHDDKQRHNDNGDKVYKHHQRLNAHADTANEAGDGVKYIAHKNAAGEIAVILLADKSAGNGNGEGDHKAHNRAYHKTSVEGDLGV